MNNRLKELRERSRLTVRELEEKTNISNSTISQIENGKREMNMRVAIILADFFNVSLDYLMYRTNE